MGNVVAFEKAPLVEDEQSEPLDHFITRDGVEYAGTHLIIDIIGGKRLNDAHLIEKAMRQCVAACGATLLHILLHHFAPEGVSGVAVLAESHISVHTWPERNYAAFDVFMCGDAKPELAVDILKQAFDADEARVETYLRGRDIS